MWERGYFLHSCCLFLFSRSSSWPFVNRNCLLIESINSILAFNLRYLWLCHGGYWNYFFMLSGERGIVVYMRGENDQKTVQWLSIAFTNKLMGIDEIQLIWRVLSRPVWIIWKWRIFCRCENDSCQCSSLKAEATREDFFHGSWLRLKLYCCHVFITDWKKAR